MSSTIDHISRIEEKLASLLIKVKTLTKENEKIKKELEDKNKESEAFKEIRSQLELQVDLMKSTESQESRTARASFEKKINDYIKEIDKCIALLGDQEH